MEEKGPALYRNLFLLWIAALFILFGITYIFWPSLSPVLHTADINILRAINSQRLRTFDTIFLFLTNTSSIIYLLITVFVALLGWFKKSNRMKFRSLQLFTAFLSSYVVIKTLKFTIGRERPFNTYDFLEKLATVDSPSFPSGHTFEAFALATSIVLLFRQPALRICVIIWAVLVGFSRMVLGVHYFTDVVAGMILGVITAYLVHLYFLSIPANQVQQKSPS